MLRKSIGKKLTFLLLTALLVLSACGNGSGSNKNADGKNGQITLSLWNSWAEDSPENKVMKDRVKAFQKAHPEIKIDMQVIPPDQYKTKLKTQAAGKQLPDMMQTWPGADLRPLAEGGVLMPLDKSFVANWKDKIPAGPLSDYAIDGKQYAIPGNKVFTSVIYYDKDMLAKVGYDKFPTTYQDLLELVKKLRAAGITPFALGNKAKWPLQSVYISTIADRYTGSDFLQNVVDGKKKFTDPQFVKALSVIAELSKDKAFNSDANSIDDNQASDYFLRGKAAMFVNGTWALSGIIQSAPQGKNIGVAKFPAVEDGKGDPAKVSGTTGFGIALNSNLSDAKKKAAYTFLKFYYQDDLYKGLMEVGTLVPAQVDVPADAKPLFKETVDLTNGGISPVYDAVLPADVIDVLNNGLQGISVGQATPKDVAKQMQDALDNK